VGLASRTVPSAMRAGCGMYPITAGKSPGTAASGSRPAGAVVSAVTAAAAGPYGSAGSGWLGCSTPSSGRRGRDDRSSSLLSDQEGRRWAAHGERPTLVRPGRWPTMRPGPAFHQREVRFCPGWRRAAVGGGVLQLGPPAGPNRRQPPTDDCHDGAPPRPLAVALPHSWGGRGCGAGRVGHPHGRSGWGGRAALGGGRGPRQPGRGRRAGHLARWPPAVAVCRRPHRVPIRRTGTREACPARAGCGQPRQAAVRLPAPALVPGVASPAWAEPGDPVGRRDPSPGQQLPHQAGQPQWLP
jgi:hypothetical protein